MYLHNVKSLKRYSCVALATALLFTSLSSVAQTLPEKDFLTRDVGNGVYELAVDSQQNALLSPRRRRLIKIKPAGLSTNSIWRNSRRLKSSTPVVVPLPPRWMKKTVLYVGNTLEGSVTLVDTRSGKELAILQLSEAKTRKILFIRVKWCSINSTTVCTFPAWLKRA